MAKGDTFTVTVLDEFELTFQLNLKRAELAKRNDASKLTHVVVNFDAEGGSGGAPPPGFVNFLPLSADVPEGEREIIPIQSDDPKFTRLYRVGVVQGLGNQPAPAEVRIACRVKLTPPEGESQRTSIIPNDPLLCRFIVKNPAPLK